MAFVQKTALVFADNATSVTVTLNGVAAGNFVALQVACTPFNVSPALTVSSPWLTAIAPTGYGTGSYRPTVAIFYKENVGSGSHAGTVSAPAGSYFGATITEHSGMATSGSLDVSSQNGSAVAVAVGNTGTTATTAQANELVIAQIAISFDTATGAVLAGPPSVGYASIGNEPNYELHVGSDSGYKDVSATGTQTASWTWTQPTFYAAAVATFKAASAPQRLSPTSDLTAGTWTPSSGPSLFAMLNEAVASDASFDATSQASTFKVALAAGTNPGVTTGHIVRYRILGSQTASLMQGATVIASWSQTPTTLTTYAQTLTGPQAATITDYAALSLQFQAT